MGVKCQQDMSDHFVLQCLGVALLNNGFDADGQKTPIPTSCECDCDGALTMRILNLCAEEKPSCLLDIKFFDGNDKEFVLANCGSVAPYFADPDNEQECLKKIAEGDAEARDKLIVHNLRLVAYIVNKKYPDYKDADDLVSIGTIGLIRAAETFDCSQNNRFSTYASRCIDNAITNQRKQFALIVLRSIFYVYEIEAS